MLVQNLKITPSRSLDDSTLTQYNLNLPMLEIEGIAHRDIYDNARINLTNLALRNATITITPPYLKNDSVQKSIITPEKLYKILGQNFNEIKLDKFSVLNSHLNVGGIFSGKSLNIQSQFLQIDSTLKSWHKIADSTLINGQELVYNLDKGQFKVSTFQSENNLHSLDLTKVNFTYEDLRDQITVEYLSFKGVELDSIINQKKFNIDSITLFKPLLEFSYKDLKQQSKQKNDWKFPDKPINILLKKGALKYQIDEYRNLNIADLDVEVNYQNELKLFQIVANELMLQDDKLKHQISMSNLIIPKNQNKLLLRNIEIQPQTRNDSLSISVKIPEINFTNFNKDAVFQDKKFEADSMLTKISQLNYTGTKDLKKYFNFSEEGDSDLSFHVQNSKIELTGSSIILLNLENKKSQIINSGAKLELQNLNFPKKANQNIFFADNFSISNDHFIFYSGANDTISINNLRYNSISKNGAIQEFNFHGSDSTTYLEIKNAKLKNAEITDYIKNNRIDIQEFSSEKTSLNLEIKTGNNSMLPQSIKLPFKNLMIDQLLSKDINIKLYHEERDRNYYVRSADLYINSLALDSTLNPKKIHHHIKSLVFSGKKYRENFGKHYTVSAENYSFRYPESNFEAVDIKMRSKYDRFEYSDHIDSQNDWFKLDLASLKLQQLNIDSLLISQKFIVNKLDLNKGDFTVFRDLNIPHNDDRKVSMPQNLLSKLDFAFSVDTIFINSNINIHIVPKETSGIGTLAINVDSGYVFDMRTHHFKNSKRMLLQAKGKLNEKANFNTKVNFPMPSEKGEFHFVGNIGPMDLKNLNDMLIPLGAIEVRSGYNEGVNINFSGNEDYAEGLMEFRYNNLKIDILDRETYQSKGFGNNLKTIFANSFVVSSKNPRWFKLQEGNIFFERIKSRSVFNFWAKALLSGAVSSIGINKSKEEAKAYYKENQEQIEE
jgi:hypothetical protein